MKSTVPTQKVEIKDAEGRVISTKEAVTYPGLLNRATQEGLKKVYTELIQTPTEENKMTAISMAEVVTERGVFRDYGDASPENVTEADVPSIIRVAITRAKARAMKDALNVGEVAAEELPIEVPNIPVEKEGSVALRQKPKSHTEEKEEKPEKAAEDDSEAMTDNQRRYLFRLLAERNIQAQDAEDWIRERLNVESLKDATKKGASDLIAGILSREIEVFAGKVG